MKKGLSPNVEFNKLLILYQSKVKLYLGSLLNATALAFVFRETATIIELLVWIFVHFLYLSIKVTSASYFNKNIENAKISPSKYELIYLSISLFGGLGWGMASLYFLEGANPQQVLIVAVLLAATVSGSLATNSGSLKTSIAFICSIIIPYSIAITRSTISEKAFMVGMCLFFIIIILGCVKYIHDTLTDSIKFRLSTEKLLTDLQSSKELREVAQNQALESTKMASIGELASGFAHEINNPLTIINGNLVLLKKKYQSLNLDSVDAKAFERCFESIKRITELINSLKDLSRGNTTSEEVDYLELHKLNDVIENATRLMNEKLKIHQIEFDVEVHNPFVEIGHSHKDVTQLILNLITNSYRLIMNSDNSWIRLKSYQSMDQSIIEICCSNTGLTQDMVDRFLDPFYIPNEKDPEFGTILSLSKTQAEKHGHKLEFIEKKDYSCFLLKLANSQPSK